MSVTTFTRPGSQRQIQEILSSVLVLIQKLLDCFPSSYIEINAPLVVIKSTLDRIQRQHITVDFEMLNEKLSQAETLMDSILHRWQHSKDIEAEEEDNANPPDDFRQIPIFPTTHDLHLQLVQQPFLRSNKKQGGYNDVQHYLDVQFRLLREDFICPLREGIAEYLQSRGIGEKYKKLQDVRIYHDVHIVHPVCTSDGLAFRLQFDVSRLQRVRWQASKRLIFGSLVCLSKDNFETLLFATVDERNAGELQSGFITVKFQHYQENIRSIPPTDSFIMAETSAYFEAYRHVLQRMQEVTEEEFPFQKYIIRTEETVEPPRYLRGQQYDLTPLTRDVNQKAQEEERFQNWRQRLRPRLGLFKDIDSSEKVAKTKVTIEDIQSWPKPDVFHLDKSQLTALQTALTKEFAVIQGPPGTGKTYVGLKIVQALLHNKAIWERRREPSPLLVVCYTNHALDQFIEGIGKFHSDGIIRVGGRSSSAQMQKYLLKNVKAAKRRMMPREVLNMVHKTYDNLKQYKSKIEKTVYNIQLTEKGVIHERNFGNDIISDQHFERLQLAHIPDVKDGSLIVNWLGLGSFIYCHEDGRNPDHTVANEGLLPQMEEVPQAAQHNKNDQNAADDDTLDEEVIHVEEEAELLMAARMVDQNEDDELLKETETDPKTPVRLALDLESLTIVEETVDDSSPDNQTENVNDNQWQVAGMNNKKRKRLIERNLTMNDMMTKEEAAQIRDIWALDYKDRWRLYRYWVALYCNNLLKLIHHFEDQYEEEAQKLKEGREMEDLQVMKTASVIAMTTTGAAKYKTLLQEIKPIITIVEEAAEVLESHIVTSLTSGCQHLILIGDHKQLRPSPTVYRLAKGYNLEISLFERMINNRMRCDCLEWQHRMRPEIAHLMDHIYPELKNHESVENFDNIQGIASNIFFINHAYEERHQDDNMSHSNVFEAAYAVALCKYLIQQGYSPSQITILTAYTGQLFLIKKKMPRKFFDGVRVTAVDNFQGEENDIVILSLVRSNIEGKIGFVGIENRVCVSLSRAKKGLYILGNFDMFSKRGELWRKILHQMGNSVGPALELYCQNHPNSDHIKASKAEDFYNAPEGGCMQPCDYRLDCGHVCQRACHPYDRDHEEYNCTKPCPKKCPSGHQCRQYCYQNCGKCTVIVQKEMPICKHIERIPCFKNPRDQACRSPCDRILPCQHACSNVCSAECTTKCREIVKERKWACGHINTTECWQSPDKCYCPAHCNTLLECGHKCAGTCGSCTEGRLHIPCTKPCRRTLVCGHVCHDTCSRSCPPCQRMCQNRCLHSRCKKVCGELCTLCNERCDWLCDPGCDRYECTMTCHDPCSRPPCNKRCQYGIEKCHHRCIGLCGEDCPTKCRICNKKEVTEIFFGNEDDPNAKFIQLMDCSHIFEVKALDAWMQSSSSSDGDKDIQMKTCPRCKTPIRRSKRYRSIINSILRDIEQVKQLVRGSSDIIERMKVDLNCQLPDLRMAERIFARCIESQLENKNTEEEMACVQNQVTFVIKIHQLQRKIIDIERVWNDDDNVDQYLNEEVVKLLAWIKKPRKRITEQECNDCNSEIFRLQYLYQYVRLLNTACYKPEAKVKVEQMIRTLRAYGPLTEEKDKGAKAGLNELSELLNIPEGLGITEEERVLIVKAMGLTRGHWFKCPNGHVYVIGDCGGATEESKCNVCKATIGGTGHRLRNDNRLASEMDGARHAAWSDQVNMENYVLDD